MARLIFALVLAAISANCLLATDDLERIVLELEPTLVEDADRLEEPPVLEDEPALGEAQKNDTKPWLHKPDNKLTFFGLINGRHWQTQYVRISNVLEQSLPSNADLEANLAQAREWLEIEKERGEDYANCATVAALNQFLELAKLDEPETRCSRRAYDILYKNDKATEHRARQAPGHIRPVNRMDLLVHKAARRHALACLDVYPARYAERCAAMDQRSLELLHEYLNKLVANERYPKNGRPDMRSADTIEIAYQLIEQNSHDDPDRKQIAKSAGALDAGRARALAKRYIVEPCGDYVRRLGRDVFIPARYSMPVLNRSERYGRAHVDFLYGWLLYKLCESLVRHDKETFLKAVTRRYQSALSQKELRL